jgi:hypothetical protein
MDHLRRLLFVVLWIAVEPAAASDPKQEPGTVCRPYAVSEAGDLTYSYYGYVERAGTPSRTVYCPVFLDNPAYSGGLEDIEAWVKPPSSGTMTCRFGCADDEGTLEDYEDQTTSGTSIQKLDWASVGWCPGDGYMWIRCPLSNGARVYGIRWVEAGST